MTVNQHDNSNINTDSSFFNSVDFQKFLKENTNALLQKTNSDIFKSRDSVSSTLFAEQLFKSKESFSNLFNSMDSNNNKSSSELQEQEDFFRSKDWKNLGSHIDVRYSPEHLFSEASGAQPDTACSRCRPPTPEIHREEDQTVDKTNWGDFFFSQLHPPAESTTTTPSTATATTTATTTVTAPFNFAAAAAARISTAPSAVKPRRRRKSSTTANNSKKKADNGRPYVLNPTDVDILLGRGGKSNHHPGNKRYREEIKNFQLSYQQLQSKEDKTDLSRHVVDHVHGYKGRFLSLDKDVRPNRWYEVTDIVARRKVSQALREDDDPVKRREKRARYLDRKLNKKNNNSTAQGHTAV